MKKCKEVRIRFEELGVDKQEILKKLWGEEDLNETKGKVLRKKFKKIKKKEKEKREERKEQELKIVMFERKIKKQNDIKSLGLSKKEEK